jgi:DUF4097 and DUF4098 domain-containing protein YvlB
MPEYDRSEPVTIALYLPRGRADIVAEDRTTVVADVVPLDGSDGSGGAATDTLITLEGDTLAIRAPRTADRPWRRGPKLGVTVRVPTGSSIAAKCASADLHAAGRFATVHVNLASGDAAVEEITGDGHLDTASGDLAVGRAGGSLRVSTASGDVEIGDVTGDVSVRSASGDITIRDSGGSVDADTASGDIGIGVLRRGQAGLRSASGDVKVGVAAGTGVWLDVSTASGSTRNDLAMGAGTPGATPASTGATLELRIRTASGDIEIRRAAAATPAAA